MTFANEPTRSGLKRSPLKGWTSAMRGRLYQPLRSRNQLARPSSQGQKSVTECVHRETRLVYWAPNQLAGGRRMHPRDARLCLAVALAASLLLGGCSALGGGSSTDASGTPTTVVVPTLAAPAATTSEVDYADGFVQRDAEGLFRNSGVRACQPLRRPPPRRVVVVAIRDPGPHVAVARPRCTCRRRRHAGGHRQQGLRRQLRSGRRSTTPTRMRSAATPTRSVGMKLKIPPKG